MFSYKERTVFEGMKVFVYYNLHQHVFSVKALEGEDKGKVVAHSEEVFLTDCVFQINQNGREKVLRERRKNVHAGVVGYLSFHLPSFQTHSVVTYDPYFFNTFVHEKTLQPIHRTPQALLKNKRVYV